MDVTQEVSSTCETEVSLADEHIILELDASSSSCNEISLADAANALITLQVPGKETITSSTVFNQTNGEAAEKNRDNAVSSSPKDIRKKILEGMKSQFNTKEDDDAPSERIVLSTRRSLLRTKSKAKLSISNNVDDDILETSPSQKASRNRGRPPKGSPVANKASPPKVSEPELEMNGKISRELNIETVCEKTVPQLATPPVESPAVVTRRSQRTVIRTSAAELLKGNLVRKAIKRSASETDLSGVEKQETNKPEIRRKRGRPSRTSQHEPSGPQVEIAVELSSPSSVTSAVSLPESMLPVDPPPESCPEPDDLQNTASSAPDTMQKVEHMASLGLQRTADLNNKDVPKIVKKKHRQMGRLVSLTKKAPRLFKPKEKRRIEPKGSVTCSEERQVRVGSSLHVRMEGLMQTAVPQENVVNVREIRVNVEVSPTNRISLTAAPVSRNNSPAKNMISEEEYLCLCTEAKPPVAASSQLPIAPTLYCQAVDSVGGKLVGCCRTASSRKLHRPATRIPYMLLCESHKERLRKHFCCPGCGFFCTQGLVLQCQDPKGSPHFYHSGCRRVLDGKNVCPHCGKSDSSKEIRLQMKTCAVPVFCSDSKLLRTVPTAKITISKPLGLGLDKSKSNGPTFISPRLVLPSGRELTSQGMPDTIDRNMLESILSAFRSSSVNNRVSSAMPVHVAAKQGDVEKIISCLHLGQNINKSVEDTTGQTALHAACLGGHLAAVHVIVQSGASLDILDAAHQTPLMLAVQEGHNDIVKYLIKASASITLKGEGGMTVLHVAAKCGNLEAVHYIMSCVSSKQLINSQDDGGWTPLVWGCEHQRIHIVRYLLQCKADPLVRDAELNTALHWAAYSGSMDIAALLLDNGCDANAVNLHQDTPLHIAARRDNYECVLLFITRGASLQQKNKDGFTPVQVCPDETCHSALLLTLNAKLHRLTHSRMASTADKLISNDITNGKESNPIQCFNGIDLEKPPADYVYVTENCFTSPIDVDRTINSLKTCQCEDDCSSDRCSCSSLSFRCWYDDEGKLVPEFNYADPPMLFECNRACGCQRYSCSNRVVQHGISARLVLFRSPCKGWGVRTSHLIAKGSYVCEYIGEIISDYEADQREDDSYLFDLDNRDGETYCIDARRYGNIARFINHSCEPNLIPVKVFVDHQDLKFPRIAFFAARDIQINEELAFDYGEKFWIIKYKSFTCACSSPKCKYSQLTIHRTVEEYTKGLQEANINS